MAGDKRTRLCGSLGRFFGYCLVGTLLGGCDFVTFGNHSSRQIGLLMDGGFGANDINDSPFVTDSDTANVGPVSAGTRNEIIGFESGRPVALLENVRWTEGNDSVLVNFADEMGVTVHVWLVQGPEADRRAQAIAACVKVEEIWSRERMGTRITGFEIHDATADPEANQFLDFMCSKAGDLRNRIGFTSGAVNMYFVNRVDFGDGLATANGVWCNDNTLVLGSNASDHLSAHELGHAFALDHVNDLANDFDTTNVMHGASDDREYLTEGQIFRAHFRSDSVINATYHLRPGLPTRNCGKLDLTQTPTCPQVQRRIWADGTYLPN